jgi:hypothetical protein
VIGHTGKKPRTSCAGCSRTMAKAHAVHEGQGYCGACYKRLFEPASCPVCGRAIKSLGGQAVACRTCRAGDRHCLRCGKVTLQAGLVREDGVVCPSCVRYYKAPGVCSICGEESHHLARDSRLGYTEPACPKCRRKGHITCPICRKHRMPGGALPDGREVCASCLDTAGVQFVCPRCGRSGQRHSRDRCEKCYWEEKLEKDLPQVAAELGQEWVREAFTSFCRQLAESCGAKRTRLRIPRHLEFFHKLDGGFARRSDVSLFGLVEMLGLEGIRRAAHPYGFLAKEGFLPEHSMEALKTAAESKRQLQIVDRNAGAWFVGALEAFHAHQQAIRRRYDRCGWTGARRRFVPRTVTSNLQAAEKFLVWIDTQERGFVSTHQIEANILDEFLMFNPGYSMPIRAFIRFLKLKKRVFRELTIPHVNRHRAKELLLSQSVHEDLLRRWLTPDDRQLKKSLACLLMTLYVQQGRTVAGLRLDAIKKNENDEYEVRFTKIWLPLEGEIGMLLKRYLASREVLHSLETGANPYLFPGRHHGSHISAATISGYLKEFGVTGGALFSSGLFSAYMNGAHPKSLVYGFGICTATAYDYYDMVGVRTQQELKWERDSRD